MNTAVVSERDGANEPPSLRLCARTSFRCYYGFGGRRLWQFDPKIEKY